MFGPSLRGAGAHSWDCQTGSGTKLWLQPQLQLLPYLMHVNTLAVMPPVKNKCRNLKIRCPPALQLAGLTGMSFSQKIILKAQVPRFFYNTPWSDQTPTEINGGISADFKQLEKFVTKQYFEQLF